MSILVQTSDGFALDARRAHECLVTSSDPTSVDGSKLEVGRRYALVAPSRGTFIRGLLAVWSAGALPVLLPRTPALRESSSSAEALPLTAEKQAPLGAATFRGNDVVCDLLTSGSTGRPQIYSKTARQLFGEALALGELLGLSASDTVAATTASHHLYGLLFGVLAPLLSGSRVIASPDNEPEAFHPDKIARLAATLKVSHLVSVPAHLRALLEAPIALPSVRVLISSAAPLDPIVAERLEDKFGVTVIDVLGSTETGGIATRRAAHENAWNPLPGVRVRLDEDERLLIQSPFLERPDTEQRSDERACVHDDGTFEYLGRADDVVKVGGKRISLGQIERLVRAIPGVTDCACLSRPVSGLRGEEILLAAVPHSLTKDALRTPLRAQLDPAFLPRKIRLVPALPRDERGKLKRADLLDLFAVSDAPVTLVEKSITVPRDWPRFDGHFDSAPILPALSQLADFVLPEIRRAFGGGALAALKRVKWTHAIGPGAELQLRLEKKPRGISFQLLEGSTPACSGTAILHSKGP